MRVLRVHSMKIPEHVLTTWAFPKWSYTFRAGGLWRQKLPCLVHLIRFSGAWQVFSFHATCVQYLDAEHTVHSYTGNRRIIHRFHCYQNFVLVPKSSQGRRLGWKWMGSTQKSTISWEKSLGLYSKLLKKDKENIINELSKLVKVADGDQKNLKETINKLKTNIKL